MQGMAARALLATAVAIGRVPALVHAKGGGGAAPPPPPVLFIDADERELCDPCAELWAERYADTSYAGMDLRQTPHYGPNDLMAQTPFADQPGSSTASAYAYGQNEAWGVGYRSWGSAETCNNVETTPGRPVYFDLDCTVMEEGAPLSADAPVFCEPGDTTRVRTLTCDDTDPGDATASPRYIPGTAELGAYLLPCTAAFRSSGPEGYTPLQACCRCGGGTYTDTAPAPPAPPPPLASAAAMCTALPGCCYSASLETCGQSTPTTFWDNGKKVSNPPAVPLTGCCFSPEWRAALNPVPGTWEATNTHDPTATKLSHRAPKNLRYARFASPYNTNQGPDVYADVATCSAATDWPVYTVGDEPTPLWMREAGSNQPISGVGLVFCKEQGWSASAPGWAWYDMAPPAGVLGLWILYQIIAQPITGGVWLCCQDKKAEGKEPDCPKAAGIVIGGTCLCCAPCICVMICTGSAPLFKRTGTPQMVSGIDCGRIFCLLLSRACARSLKPPGRW